MDWYEASPKAMAVLKGVVVAIAEDRYEDLPTLTQMGDWTPETLRGYVTELFLAWGWEQPPQIDRWTGEWIVSPTNPCYKQLEFYHFNDKSGFHVDYDLTSDGEPNDLTLQMEFLYDSRGGIRPVLLDLHVM